MMRITESLLAIFMIVLLTSCGDDNGYGDRPVAPDVVVGAETGAQTTYILNSVANPEISGSVAFIELNNNSTRIVIELDGTTAGGVHPAHIHYNSASEGGGIAISLLAVDGTTGKSETVVVQDITEAPISYAELLEFDGYLNVHLSAEELSTIVAQGNIGVNADQAANSDGSGYYDDRDQSGEQDGDGYGG